MMRIVHVGVALAVALGLTSCNQNPHRDDAAARQAGREAFKASKDLKRDAREAARELQSAGKEFREGWNDARREDNRARQSQRSREKRTPAQNSDKR